MLKAATAAKIIVLSGGMGRRRQAAALDHLGKSSDAHRRVVLATGRFIGEGFDDPRLDALFLAMPISWRGTLQQYAGRLHRDHVDKQEIRIYDYVDASVPTLTRMFKKTPARLPSDGLSGCRRFWRRDLESALTPALRRSCTTSRRTLADAVRGVASERVVGQLQRQAHNDDS